MAPSRPVQSASAPQQPGASSRSNCQLYDGVGTGVMSVDATGKTPLQSFRFSLSNLDAYPFLNDAVGFQRIEGNTAIAIDLTTSGASQRAMMSALNGTAKFEFTDG